MSARVVRDDRSVARLFSRALLGAMLLQLAWVFGTLPARAADPAEETNEAEETPPELPQGSESEATAPGVSDEDLPTTSWSGAGSAVDAPAPTTIGVKAHSKVNFAVYQGDVVTLQVELEDEGAEVRWLRSDAVLCRTVDCQLNTAEWGLGVHRVVLLLTRGTLTRTVTFRIRILAAPPLYRPGEVAPQMTEPRTDPSTLVNSADFVVVAQQGRGFVLGTAGVSVVGKIPRAVARRDQLRSQAGGVLRLGRSGEEEIWLLPSSELVHDFDSERVLTLRRGAVRVRSLSGGSKPWRLAVEGSPVSFGLGESFDALVRIYPGPASTDPQEVSVTVMRGKVHLMHAQKSGDGGGVSESVEVAAGKTVRFALVGWSESQVASDFRAAEVAASLALTSPHWSGVQRPEGVGSLAAPPAKLDEAWEQAKTALAAADAALALELMLPHHIEARKFAQTSLVVGRAYLEVGMHREAADWLKTSARLAPDDGEAAWWLGVISMRSRKWGLALKWFDEADERNWSEVQLLNWHGGQAAEQNGDHLGARSRYLTSLWYPKDSGLAEKAEERLAALEEFRWFHARGDLGLLWDSNVMHLPKGHDAPLAARKSAGVWSGMGLGLWGWRSHSGRLGMTFDIDRLDWIKAPLRPISRVDQVLAFDLAFSFGQDREPWLAIELKPSIAMRFYKERALDSLLTKARISSPALWDFGIGWRSQQSIDPLPGQDDILEPTLEEVVAVSDRSVSIKEMTFGPERIGSRTKHWGLLLRREMIIWTGSDNSLGDARTTAALIKGRWSLSGRSLIDGRLDFANRTFSPGDRKDRLLTTGLAWTWQMSAELGTSLGLNWSTQTSSAEQTWSGWQLRWGLRFEI
jgi:tetratricopeptide (TPR) repeat protein